MASKKIEQAGLGVSVALPLEKCLENYTDLIWPFEAHFFFSLAICFATFSSAGGALRASTHHCPVRGPLFFCTHPTNYATIRFSRLKLNIRKAIHGDRNEMEAY